MELPHFKLVVIGPESVEVTDFINMMMLFLSPSCRFDQGLWESRSGKKVMVEILDVSDGDSTKMLGADGALFMVDSTKPSTFQSIHEYIASVMKVTDFIPSVIVSTKCRDFATHQESNSLWDMLAEEHRCFNLPTFAVCLKSRYNIMEPLEKLMRELIPDDTL